MTTAKITRVIFVIVLWGLTSCSSPPSPSAAPMRIPVSRLSDNPIGEQGKIVQKYGLPDNAYSINLGVTTWIYCAGSSRPVHIQFDSSGAVMNRFAFPESSCSPGRFKSRIQPTSH